MPLSLAELATRRKTTTLKERGAAQSHFNAPCKLLHQPHLRAQTKLETPMSLPSRDSEWPTNGTEWTKTRCD